MVNLIYMYIRYGKKYSVQFTQVLTDDIKFVGAYGRSVVFASYNNITSDKPKDCTIIEVC